MEPSLWFYPGLGALAGVLAGLLGIGGGLVIVPALVWWFARQGYPEPWLMQMAVATSLATILVTSVSSLAAHQRRGGVRWDLLAGLLPGIMLGALAGAVIARALPGDVLRALFGAFECWVAWRLWRQRPEDRRLTLNRAGQLTAGSIIGGLSAMLGIGGGTLTVPLLRWTGVEIRAAVGTAAAAGLPVALFGVLGFTVGVAAPSGLPQPSLGLVYGPAALGIGLTSVLFAPLGAWLAHRLPRAGLQRLFAVILFLVGLRMLLT
jgi:uncharacterized membrane protein YfcA